MARDLRPLDVSDVPELRRSPRARMLRADSDDVAILSPVTAATRSHRRTKAKTAAAYDAFRASTGSWDGIENGKQFKRDNAESRQIATRPSIDL